MKTFSWNPESLKVAAAMWNAEKSFTEIASHFGISRGSVAGKISRNREMFPHRSTGQKAETNPDPLEKEKFVKLSFHHPMPIARENPYDFSGFAIPGIESVRFGLVGRNQCRWPLSCDERKAGANMPVCGGDTGGKVYCSVHVSIARGAGTESERRAARELRRHG